MGGDTFKDDVTDEESSRSCSCCSSDDLGFRDKAHQEILQNHDLLLKSSKKKLRQARNKILSYTPGSWSDVKLSDYNVPKMTSILVIGPKGAGKSSLINRVTRVIEEDDEFYSVRAQESFGSNGGTYFVQEYMIPRGGSAAFCLYDTRGLSLSSSSDNASMIEQWMTRGVRHGEPVIWTSDSADLKDRLIQDGDTCYEMRKVNSIIFVVNAVEVLESMDYAHTISMAFNSPLLSFKDDKAALVMTHGDLLSRKERARVQVFLGELLGIPPDKQIFDIPESRDTATVLTICNLLHYSLEHADKNLVFMPKRNFTKSKVGGGLTRRINLLDLISIALITLMALASIWFVNHTPVTSQNIADKAQHKLITFPSPPNNLSYEAAQPKPCIRPQQVTGGQNLDHIQKSESSIDWHKTRGLWLDEEKVVKAEPSFDWRTARRLWYVE